MKSLTQAHQTPRSFLRFLSAILFCLTVLALSPTLVQGQQIGFRPGSTIADASINGTQGTKWNDASVLRTNELGMSTFLPDWNHTTIMSPHAVPTLMQQVQVFTKRDTANLYIAFDVGDQTRDRRNDPTPGAVVGPLTGERIILQFDANNAKGATLNNDFRLDVQFNWTGGGTTFQLLSATLLDSSGPAGLCPGLPIFAPIAFPPDIRIAATATASRYFIEFKIPLNRIGNPTGNFGFAFALINDLGYCDPVGGGCDFTSISFPSTLPVINSSNPTFDSLECQWVVPSQWGTGFFTSGLDDVTIDRTPVWWSSQAIDVFACANLGYTYFPAHPCRISMQVELINSGTATTRNLLYLWAEHGSSPSVWHVIDFAKNVAVPAGGGLMPKSGELADPAIKNKPNHPCVRVYILPPFFRPDFDEAAIMAINDQADIDLMVLRYGLQDQHNAQKNITRDGGTPDCPDAGCRIARNGNADPTKRPNDIVASSSGQPAENAATTASLGGPFADLNDSETPRLVNAAFNSPALPLPQGTQQLISTTGQPMLVSSKEADEFGGKNILVQLRAFGYSTRNSGSPYNFIEDMGGVMHFFPVEMFNDDVRKMPFELNVSNPGNVQRRIVLVFDLYFPSGSFTNVIVELDGGEKVYAPNETKVIKGTVKVIGPTAPPGGFKRWGLSLHGGVSIPHGNFNTIFNPGPNVGVDLEYRFNQMFSLEGIYTYHRFNGETFGIFTVPDLNLHQFSANGKIYGSTSPVRPFFNFGGGAYVFTPGVSTHGGLNVGGGMQFDVTPNFAVDAMYNFHNVFTSGSNTRFSTVQGGVRFRF